MHLDRSGLETLDPSECRALLGRAGVGRIAFTDRALPAIQPVNYAVHGDDVVFRTAVESRLATAAADTIVAFEIDDFDAATRTGWSVMIIGRARPVTDPARLAALHALPLISWAPGEHDRFITIRPELISGRRIPHPAPTRL